MIAKTKPLSREEVAALPVTPRIAELKAAGYRVQCVTGVRVVNKWGRTVAQLVTYAVEAPLPPLVVGRGAFLVHCQYQGCSLTAEIVPVGQPDPYTNEAPSWYVDAAQYVGVRDLTDEEIDFLRLSEVFCLRVREAMHDYFKNFDPTPVE